MAQMSFNSIQTNESGPVSSTNVGFFSLKNDGDVAVVRFMHDDVSSFELYTVHNISKDGRYRKVNCLREPEESFDKCPLCAAGERVQQRFFIHLVQYVQNENGQIVGIPKVWERSATYAHKLKSLMDEYGPLSDCVFKIKRHGVANARDTSYDILFCNPASYDSEQFPKNFKAFANFKVLGGIVLDKSFDELLTYTTTGAFPETKKVEQPQQTSYSDVRPNTIPPAYSEVNTNSYSKMGYSNISNTVNEDVNITNREPIRDIMVNGTKDPLGPLDNRFGNMQNQQVIQRPVRSYNN